MKVHSGMSACCGEQRRRAGWKLCRRQASQMSILLPRRSPLHSLPSPPLPLLILPSEDDSASAMFAPKCWKSCCCCYMQTVWPPSHLCVNYSRAIVEMTGGGRRFVRNVRRKVRRKVKGGKIERSGCKKKGEDAGGGTKFSMAASASPSPADHLNLKLTAFGLRTFIQQQSHKQKSDAGIRPEAADCLCHVISWSDRE